MFDPYIIALAMERYGVRFVVGLFISLPFGGALLASTLNWLVL